MNVEVDCRRKRKEKEREIEIGKRRGLKGNTTGSRKVKKKVVKTGKGKKR